MQVVPCYMKTPRAGYRYSLTEEEQGKHEACRKNRMCMIRIKYIIYCICPMLGPSNCTGLCTCRGGLSANGASVTCFKKSCQYTLLGSSHTLQQRVYPFSVE